MVDAETGKVQWVNTQSKKVRDRYENNYLVQKAIFQDLFRKNGAGTISCRVDESYVKKLLNFFKARI